MLSTLFFNFYILFFNVFLALNLVVKTVENTLDLGGQKRRRITDGVLWSFVRNQRRIHTPDSGGNTKQSSAT